LPLLIDQLLAQLLVVTIQPLVLTFQLPLVFSGWL
jgi:hypothetical protein